MRLQLYILLPVSLLPACAPQHAPRSYEPDKLDDATADAEDVRSEYEPTDSLGGEAISSSTLGHDAGVATPDRDTAVGVDAATSTQPTSPSASCGGVVCDVFATCEDDDDGQPHCTCAPGLVGDGQRCADIDECQQDVPVCGVAANCQNSFGGYSCNCNEGYIRVGSDCVPDTLCDDSPCAQTATCSEVTDGLTCACDEGNFGNGFYCAAQDGCLGEPCGEDGECSSIAQRERGYVCACGLGFFGETQCLACGSALALMDPALERAVRQQLGRAEDDTSPILVEDLSERTTLNAAHFGVKELTGLECWSTLRTLDLSYNEELTTQRASALSSLNHLTELHLDCTQVSDLNDLSAHPRLRVLSANVLNCDRPVPLDDATQLGRMPQLEVLDLRGQKLSNPSFLAQLGNLRSLWLGHNGFDSLLDGAALALLVELDVSFNHISALDNLERFPRLQYLNVSGNEITSLEATKNLPQLRVISASENLLDSLPNWQNLGELRNIDVSYNQLVSVELLASLAQVKWLNLAGNGIASLAPLVNGVMRGTVVVAGNPLPCETEAAHIANLRRLGVDVQGECGD